MSEQTKQSQYEQLPTPREGAILKRADWRFYDRRWVEEGKWNQFPHARMLVCSWDTSFKAKVTSDKVAGLASLFSLRYDEHGKVEGSDVYLLEGRNERMSLQQTKDAMKDMHRRWVERFPQLPAYVVVEKSANGVEIIEQLQREIQGCVPFTASVDKKLRAEAAAPALESHNVFLPGSRRPDGQGPDDQMCDAWVVEFVEQCARFRGVDGDTDDWVDAFTQTINWGRTKDMRPTVVASPAAARINIARVGGGRPTGVHLRVGR